MMLSSLEDMEAEVEVKVIGFTIQTFSNLVVPLATAAGQPSIKN